MKSLFVVLLALGLSADAFANVELWCGSTATKGRNDFPYMATIRNYKTKRHGKIIHIATVYKNGKAVLKNYVSKNPQGSGAVYTSPDADFSLNLGTELAPNGLAGFRAVIHDKDGATLIANGQFPCHKKS